MTLVLNAPAAAKRTDTDPSMAQSSVDTRTFVILAFSATAGVLVEFYDFTLFGLAAASAFPDIFFPKLPPTQALVFAYLAYAAGHPARLLGAFVFGHFGDRAGRKFAFLIHRRGRSQYVSDGLTSGLYKDRHCGSDTSGPSSHHSGNWSGR